MSSSTESEFKHISKETVQHFNSKQEALKRLLKLEDLSEDHVKIMSDNNLLSIEYIYLLTENKKISEALKTEKNDNSQLRQDLEKARNFCKMSNTQVNKRQMEKLQKKLDDKDQKSKIKDQKIVSLNNEVKTLKEVIVNLKQIYIDIEKLTS